jgi:N-acetylneuraminic acid mutarotase
MTRLQSVTTICGVCVTLAACGDPSAVGPTDPGTIAPAAPTADAAVSALAFNGTWRTNPSLLPARWRAAADVLGKSIVVVGGLGGQGPLSRVDAYNVETRTWTALKSLPVPRYDVIGATTVQGKLYVAGGAASGNNCEKTLFVYDPATNSWTRKADMPSKGCHGVQANVLGQLYVYSLYTGIAAEPTLFASYNPSTDKWVRRPVPDEVHQSWPVGGAINGKFYLTGGVDASGQADRVLQVYDPATRTWTRKSPMPTGRDGSFAAVFHGKLFVAGGVRLRDTWVLTDVVEAYDPLTDTWATGPSMLAPRGFGASAWAGGKFFTIYGTDGPLSSRVEALSTTY